MMEVNPLCNEREDYPYVCIRCSQRCEPCCGNNERGISCRTCCNHEPSPLHTLTITGDERLEMIVALQRRLEELTYDRQAADLLCSALHKLKAAYKTDDPPSLLAV